MAEDMNGCRKQDVKIIHKRKHLKKSCNDKEFLCIKRYCLTELKKKKWQATDLKESGAGCIWNKGLIQWE